MSSNRPSKAIIDLSVLANNYQVIKKIVGQRKIMPVLKADAYGHGLIQVGCCLESAGADYFGVAFLEEAIQLRQAGIKIPILVLGGLSGNQAETFLEYDLDFTASSIFKLEKINQVAAKKGVVARVHLKIDTGMERIGVHHYSAEDFFTKTLQLQNLKVVSIYSHLADSENVDHTYSMLQISRFEEAINQFHDIAGYKPICHLANSGAVLQLPASYYDLVRPGLLLYGVNPCTEVSLPEGLKPALKLVSEVVYFKVVKAGANVSYNCTYTVKQQTRVVTIPLGYGDGYPRQLSNCGHVLIRGKKYPIIGKVCMDQLMVDIGPNGEAYNGDQVVLVGEQAGQKITVEQLVALSGQDAREFLLNLKLRLLREYVGS